MTDDSDSNLRDMTDQEPTEQVYGDLYNGPKNEVVKAPPYSPRTRLGRRESAERCAGGRHGHRRHRFRGGILCFPKVLLAANAVKTGMEILLPLLAETLAEPIGNVVIGTAEGDIHDIGKNLAPMMLEDAALPA